MRIGTFLAGIAGLALAAAPIAAAAANPAAPLSVGSSVRASAPAGKSKLAAPGAIVGLVLAAAVIAAGVYIAVDDDDGPDSP